MRTPVETPAIHPCLRVEARYPRAGGDQRPIAAAREGSLASPGHRACIIPQNHRYRASPRSIPCIAQSCSTSGPGVRRGDFTPPATSRSAPCPDSGAGVRNPCPAGPFTRHNIGPRRRSCRDRVPARSSCAPPCRYAASPAAATAAGGRPRPTTSSPSGPRSGPVHTRGDYSEFGISVTARRSRRRDRP